VHYANKKEALKELLSMSKTKSAVNSNRNLLLFTADFHLLKISCQYGWIATESVPVYAPVGSDRAPPAPGTAEGEFCWTDSLPFAGRQRRAVNGNKMPETNDFRYLTAE